MTKTPLSRRALLGAGLAAMAYPPAARAQGVREITWEDLIPPGVPYSEIVGPGQMDEENDIWLPEYDANATRVNTDLEGALVRMPGYIIPMETTAQGVTEFILVPYVGACIHVPPPPPNQLVFVTAEVPWPSEDMWTAIWVTGRMQARMQSTAIAEIGYALSATEIEEYEWM